MTTEAPLAERVELALVDEDGAQAADILTEADVSQIDQASLEKLVSLAIETEPTNPFYLRVVALVSDKVRDELHEDIGDNWDIDEITQLFEDDRSGPYADGIVRAIIKSDDGLDAIYPVCIGRISKEVRAELNRAVGRHGDITPDDLNVLVRKHANAEDVDAMIDGLLETIDEETVFEFMKAAGSQLSDAQMLRLARAVQNKD